MALLDRYITRSILGAVALVITVLLVLGALLLFIQQQDDIGEGNFGTDDAFWFTLLSLPQQTSELLPIAALIGALLGLGALARGSELIVMRAAGVSVARIAGSASIAAVILIGLQIAVGEFLAPPLTQAAKQQKAFARFENVSFGGRGGAWVRDGNLILNVAQQAATGQFRGVLVFELSPEHRLQAIGRAAHASTGTRRGWLLGDYAESRFAGNRVLGRPGGERVLASNLSVDFLGVALADPRQLETRSLWRLIRYFEANDLDARPYVFAFWSRVARTAAILFAVLLAVPFVLGSLRSAGAGARTMVGLVIGVGLFLLQRLIESGTLVFDLDPVVLAWLPTTLLALVALGLLARAR